MQTPLEHKVMDLAVPVAADFDLEIVTVKLAGNGGARSLQVMAENPETRNLTIDECTKLSKALSAVLDVEDPIDGAYRLEVSSPGIDRILVKEADFNAYKGFEAKFEMQKPLESGQKKFRGLLQGIDNGTIRVETDRGAVDLPFSDLAKAKLVLTEDLIKTTGKNRKD